MCTGISLIEAAKILATSFLEGDIRLFRNVSQFIPDCTESYPRIRQLLGDRRTLQRMYAYRLQGVVLAHAILSTAERWPSSVAVQQLMSSALRRVVLSTAERWSSSVVVQQLMSSALRRVLLNTEELVSSSVAVRQLMSSALWRVVLSIAEGTVIGCCAAVDVRSTTSSTEY